MDRLRVAVGEEVALDLRGGRTVRVTPHMHEALIRIRAALAATAQARAITTYKALNEAAGHPYALGSLGLVLDVLRVDCIRRGEPPLPALVVRKSTHEVGDGYVGDAPADRADCWHHWDRGRRE